jgi:hypothetical protein
MAQTAKNVVFSKPKATGAVSSAPEGTGLPVDGSTALAADYESWGYINEDGVEEAHDLSSESVNDYGKTTVLIIDGGDEVTYEFTPLEYTNPVVQKNLYGTDNVVSADGVLQSVTIGDDAKEVKVFVFEHVLSNGYIERDVVPRGKVTGIDTTTYSAGEAIAPKVTVTAMADSNGKKVYKYFAKAGA